MLVFFFQAEDGIRDKLVTGVQTCALPIYLGFVFQSYHLFPTLKALENVRLTLDVRGERARRAVAKSKLALASVGLSHKMSRSEERRVGKECRSGWSPYQ